MILSDKIVQLLRNFKNFYLQLLVLIKKNMFKLDKNTIAAKIDKNIWRKS